MRARRRLPGLQACSRPSLRRAGGSGREPRRGAANPRARGTDLVYAPELQIWFPVCGSGDQVTHWAGIDKQHPPTPADLQRPACPHGTPVILGDGHAWNILHVPAGDARGIMSSDRSMGAKILRGKASEELPREPRWKLRLFGPSWEWLKRVRDDSPYTMSEYRRYATMLLAASYRVAWPEVRILGLLDESETTALRVVHTSLGMDWMAASNAQEFAQGKARRWCQFQRWTQGLDPFYEPTWMDMLWMHGSEAGWKCMAGWESEGSDG